MVLARKRAGVTLVEVIVAVAILGTVGITVYGGFAQTSTNKRRVEAELDRYHAIRVTMNRMVRELSMAYMSEQRNPNPALQFHITSFIGTDSGFGDRVDFNSMGHTRIYRNARESDQNELSYFITDDPSGDGTKALARRVQPRVDERPGEGGRVEIMVSDVAGFELEYLDPVSNEWVQSWDSTNLQLNRLPSQVKILLTVPDPQDPGEEITFGTRSTLQMTWALNHATYL